MEKFSMAKRHLGSNLTFILASKSPRRKELLENIGIKFDCIDPNIEERRKKGESPKKYVQRNSVEKAQAVLHNSMNLNLVVLAADTIVVIGKKVLEKPRTLAEARMMLKSLSGKTHKVLTGVCIVSTTGKFKVFAVQTFVKFKILSAIIKLLY